MLTQQKFGLEQNNLKIIAKDHKTNLSNSN